MKKLQMSIFCLCLIFSSVCLAESTARKCVEKTVATRKTKPPAIFRPFVYLFNKISGKSEPVVRPFKNLECLELSKTEVFANSTADSRTIHVRATPDDTDPTDVITYTYTVSGGKIIGRGAKVVWDLSGFKPGVYTITAAADNGCEDCGKTITMEVRVMK